MTDPDSNPVTYPLTKLFDWFIEGFLQLERGIHRVEDRRFGNVRYLHWPEDGRRSGRFTEEFFALDLDPAEVVSAVQEVETGAHYFISDIHRDRGPAIDQYLALGFRKTFEEPLMIFDLTQPIPRKDSEYLVEDVISLAVADRIREAQEQAEASPRQTSQRQIDDPNTVIKAIHIEAKPACIGKAILLDSAAYISDIGTLPEFRRRGLAGLVMSELHIAAKAAGQSISVLSATPMAAALYSKIGYQTVATLDIYEPLGTETG